jgi:hypothetical protein
MQSGYIFVEDSGYFFPPFKRNPEKYLQPCSEGVKQWLLDLKQKGKVVFLKAHDNKYLNLKYNSQNPQIFAKKGKIYPKVAFSTVVAKSRAEEVIRNTTLPFPAI